MIEARFRVRLPADAWITDVSESFPDATFRLLAGMARGDVAVELGELVADDPAAVGRQVAEHPAVRSLDRLEADGSRVLAKYETTDTGLYDFVARSGVPPEYPLTVRNGWYEFDLTGTREEFDRFRAALDDADRRHELLSVVGTTEDDGLLTEAQREALAVAVREGYFEVPRDCTLADLAAALDVDKSTASRTLRRGAATVLQWYLTGPDR